MHPPDCPPWEYDRHPRRAEVLRRHVTGLLIELRADKLNTVEVAVNTRPVHRRLFVELTPPGYDYYAGHYRGEDYRCLRYSLVGIAGDPNVGYESASASVHLSMGGMERVIREGLAVLDVNRDIPDAQLPRAQKVLQVVVFACRVFDLFLRIHPYVNGNGHIARFLIWCLLGRYGYWPEKWPVEPKPPDPPYISLIEEYRKRNWGPLEEFVLKTIA